MVEELKILEARLEGNRLTYTLNRPPMFFESITLQVSTVTSIGDVTLEVGICGKEDQEGVIKLDAAGT